MIAFRRINNVTGWIVFGVSALLYLFTMEPTVSLWDCGEFTAAAAKLEVGHPPGAPLYLMLARIFSLFAFDKSYIAICINSLSAISSALTVMFLFWTITHLARRIIERNSGIFTYKNTLIISVGLIGALAFCFSDSFWFSATEAEVYALSSLFTALVFWCILKWEEDSGKYANRWIILIAYLMGLSIGIHLLNLLAIPAIVMIYYFRNYSADYKRTIGALVIAFLILFSVLYLLIPGTIRLAAVFERLSVNFFHLPVNTGLSVFAIGIILLGIILAYITYSKRLVMANTIILCITVMLIGYSSYAMIVIRANANPPINTSNPADVYSLLAYLNRDQYGDRPLFYGPYYNAPVIETATKNSYRIDKSIYIETQVKKSVKYDNKYMTVFPRMYSNNSNHIQVYKNWGTVNNSTEVGGKDPKPTFIDNLEFFIKYQVGYMYARYFLWNFAGKQNDMQGNGGIMKGNWISGIDFIDQWFIGAQNNMPDYMKNNSGRNRYYLLPLLLGLGGMIYHFSKSRKYFVGVMLLFLLTGLAIVFYTNQTPLQPRERDYVYVGSFYAFSIWIGLGVLWIFELLRKILTEKKSVFVAVGAALCVPGIMFAQNLDDHNRNGRTIVRDIAFNYLNTCERNAILFTVGDNDTYPLWYLQEVEGIRTDVRIVNLALLNASWYIDQQKSKAYLSDPLPISLNHNEYASGKNNWIYVRDDSSSMISIAEVVKNIKNYNNKGSNGYIIPTRLLSIKTNSAIEENALDNTKDSSLIKPIIFKLPGTMLRKNEMIVLDIISNFKWERPIYFNTPGAKGTIGLNDYFQLDGFAYKLVPEYIENKPNSVVKINTDELYQKLMTQTRWSEWKDGKGLMDDHVRNMLSIMRVRQNYARLALALVEEGKKEKAEKVLDRVMEIMPTSKIPYDSYCILIGEAYYKCGSIVKGNKIFLEYGKQLQQEMSFYSGLPSWMKEWVKQERSHTSYYLNQVEQMLKKYKRHYLTTSF